MNRAEQDYIKAIYELTYEQGQEVIKTSELAARFSITDQSVNEMVKKLASKKWIVFIPYKGVSLTQQGFNKAIEMVRAHRLWEVFLTQTLGFSWHEVHEDAETLEHATSIRVLDALDRFLGFPKYCQHGNPIPDKNGTIEKRVLKSLCVYPQHTRILIERVTDSKPLLEFLDLQNIKIGDTLSIENIDTFNQIITVIHAQKKVYMHINTAQMIYGTEVN